MSEKIIEDFKEFLFKRANNSDVQEYLDSIKIKDYDSVKNGLKVEFARKGVGLKIFEEKSTETSSTEEVEQFSQNNNIDDVLNISDEIINEELKEGETSKSSFTQNVTQNPETEVRKYEKFCEENSIDSKSERSLYDYLQDYGQKNGRTFCGDRCIVNLPTVKKKLKLLENTYYESLLETILIKSYTRRPVSQLFNFVA